MASMPICTSCLRAIRLQARRELQSTYQSSRHLHPISNPLSRQTTQTFSTLPPHQFSDKQPPPPPRTEKPQPTQQDAITTFASQVRNTPTLKSTTEPYIAYGSTQSLFHECARQCAYTVPSALTTPPTPAPKNSLGEDVGEGEGWWYQPHPEGGLGLDVTFNTWAQVMFLHMYMLTVRLRCFPAEHARTWHQNLLDHFFYAAEDRMAMWHGMAARGTRNKYLKDLLEQWRGVLLSYDEGIIKGDAVLAGAVWRNVFKGGVGVRVEDVAVVTAYMRRELQMLDSVSDERIAGGEVRFGDPGGVRGLVEKESPRVRERVSEEKVEVVGEKQKSV